MTHLRALPVALLAFMIGVVISPIHFEVEGMGAGRLSKGADGFSMTSYRSSCFVQLNFAHAGNASTAEADALFDQLLTEAVEVIEITPKVDAHGRAVGRRGVAFFIDQQMDRHFASVFWTQGTLVHSINSTSLMHVLDFEKQNVVD